MHWFVCIFTIGLLFKLFREISCKYCVCDPILFGKVILITDAHEGVGYEAAKYFARCGGRVIITSNDTEKGEQAQKTIMKETKTERVIFNYLDLSSFTSIRKFVDDFKANEGRLDILVNNNLVTEIKNVNEENIRRYVKSRCFSPYLITHLLLDLLKKSEPSRIVTVTSLRHIFGDVKFHQIEHEVRNGKKLYADINLYRIMFTNQLAKILEGSGVVANSVHLGTILTDVNTQSNNSNNLQLLRNLFGLNAISGAQTLIHVSVSEECGILSGKLFVNCKTFWMSHTAKHEVLAGKLCKYIDQTILLNRTS